MDSIQDTILVCPHSLEGVFTAVYIAYRDKLIHDHTHIQTSIELEEQTQQVLFSKYREISSEEELFCKVRRTLIERMGWEVYEQLCEAMAMEKPGIADSIYHTIVRGLSRGPNTGVYVLQDLTNPYIYQVARASQNVWREIHHLMGFVRFEELAGEEPILYSRIGPQNNVVTFLAPHFADRFPMENFMIHDSKRGIFVVHPRNRPWYVRLEQSGNPTRLPPVTKEEETYRELFREFCKAIMIQSRRNDKLQRQMLPIRFREFMVEFS